MGKWLSFGIAIFSFSPYQSLLLLYLPTFSCVLLLIYTLIYPINKTSESIKIGGMGTMRVQIMENVWEYSNDLACVEEMFARIDAELIDSNLLLSHLIVDDVDVYDDYKSFIANNIGDLKEVRFVVITLVEMVTQILQSAKDYLERAYPELQAIIDQLYQGASSSTWITFGEFLDGLQWIMQTIESLNRLGDETEVWTEYKAVSVKLEEVLIDMQEAVVNVDAVLLADMLHYEVLPVFTNLHELLQHTLRHKVVNKHVN